MYGGELADHHLYHLLEEGLGDALSRDVLDTTDAPFVVDSNHILVARIEKGQKLDPELGQMPPL